MGNSYLYWNTVAGGGQASPRPGKGRMSNYWDKYWSRRRLMGTAGVAGFGAASLALVGCGGGDDDSGNGGASGLATATAGVDATPTPTDPFATAVKGGTYKLAFSGDPPTIDPLGNTSFLTRGISCYVYGRLFRYKAGPGISATDVKPEGDLVQTAEASADGLTWTLKLKPAKFHNVAPVSGRTLNTDDIRYSWGRMTDVKNTNAVNFNFVDKVEYPDASTVVFKLKTPNAGFKELLTDTTNLIIMPKEADGGFDISKQMIGTGPFQLDSYSPSVNFKLKKNPDWVDKGAQGFPLFDNVDISIIPEYATRLAQFRAGNLDSEGLNAADLVDTKGQLPNMQLFGYVAPQANYIFFDSDPNSPFQKDPRVRQAVSMSYPRDDISDLVYDVKRLKAAGIDVKAPWNNFIPAGMTRFWLDPQGKDMGDSAKYFKYDQAEAKKLMAAAGFESIDAVTYQYTANRYGKGFNDAAEATLTFINQIGIKTTTDVQDYASKYITQTFAGNFKGIVFALQTVFTDVGGYSARMFADNPLNHGRIKDPAMLDLHTKQQQELDEVKRKDLIYQIQRMNAEKMYYPASNVGAGTTWTGHQSYVKNGVDFVVNGYGGGTEVVPYRYKTQA